MDSHKKVIVLELWGNAPQPLASIADVFAEFEAGQTVSLTSFTMSLSSNDGYNVETAVTQNMYDLRAAITASLKPFDLDMRIGVFAKIFNAIMLHNRTLPQECRVVTDLADACYGGAYIMTYAERADFRPDRLLQLMGLDVPEAHGAMLAALVRAKWGN